MVDDLSNRLEIAYLQQIWNKFSLLVRDDPTFQQERPVIESNVLRVGMCACLEIRSKVSTNTTLKV